MLIKYFFFAFSFLALVSCLNPAVIKEPDSDINLGNKTSGGGSSVSGKVPYMAFSDLISGPSTGLGDGKGSGVIVTVWGYKFGTFSDTSTVEFCPNSGGCIKSDHIYYWKNADGILPSGPANLYESHGMQEVAFSIPNTGNGPGTIRLSNSFGYSELPFTIRDGNIYHVMNSGNDSSGDGSFANPWLTVAKGDSGSGAGAGDTLYIHNVDTTSSGTSGTNSYAYYLNQGFSATEANQFVYASYPNTRANLYGKVGVGMYLTTGIVSSKLSVYASNCTDETLEGCSESGTKGITPSDFGRVIGNKVTDVEGMCASGQSGAISGGYGEVSGAKIFGNYIHDYGCPNTGKLHHTTYMTLRDNDQDRNANAWEMGWNHLKDNWAKNGLHIYDEDAGAGPTAAAQCGDLIGDMLIHDNVVVNQSGAGIYIGIGCGYTMDSHVYNNVLINVGLPLDVDCITGPACGGSVSNAIEINDGGDNGLLGDVYLYNNTVHTWDATNQTGGLQSCIAFRGPGDNGKLYINDNVCFTATDRAFFTTFSFAGANHSDNVFGSGNSWFSSAGTSTLSVVPGFDTAPLTTDPLLNLSGSLMSIGVGSPLINKSSSTLPRGVYSKPRTTGSNNVGAIQ